ncbi:hypothetical protein F5Y14DRAFT_328551 [Nemania sp. NC0429]|nr:hypothetical protein F5Y14DRAFT_328551 [Nemania sp. NC0429]
MSRETRVPPPHVPQGARLSTGIPRTYQPASFQQSRNTPSTTDQQRGPSTSYASRYYSAAAADASHGQARASGDEATRQGGNGAYSHYNIPTGGGTANTGNANADAHAAKQGGEKGSVWERTAARLGGHDGGPGSAFRGSRPLPAWLRDP